MIIRTATAADLPLLEEIARAMGAHHEAGYFQRCLEEQAQGRRNVYLLLADGRAAGYVQLNFTPVYAPFRRLDIPEIQDLNILPAYRQQGLGGLLVDHCEKIAVNLGKTDIGISVGVSAAFGPAQRLYVKKGYVPDGAGIAYDDVSVRMGELKPVDDLLTLKLVKSFG